MLGKFSTRTGGSNPFLSDGNNPIKTQIFFHRTNNDGKATHSSKGCPNIDGRQWRSVERQLGKSKDIYFRIQ